MGWLISMMPGWLLFILIFLLGIASAYAGSRFKPKKTATEKDEDSGVSLAGALLALLAFMLGFTLSITADRLADRKALIIRQANAIGTCYLRTSFLPQKQQLEIRRLLRESTELLVVTNPENVHVNVGRIEKIYADMWVQAASTANENIDSELRSLFVSSVNDLREIYNERKTVVMIFRIPSALWSVLIVLYVLSMLVVGAELHAQKFRYLFITILGFALTVVVIADMDSVMHTKHFILSQQALVDVQEMMKEGG